MLIVFSDGIDTTSWLQPDAAIRAAQRSEVVVYGVSTAPTWQTPAREITEFTESTGGELLEVNSSALAEAFARVRDDGVVTSQPPDEMGSLMTHGSMLI